VTENTQQAILNTQHSDPPSQRRAPYTLTVLPGDGIGAEVTAEAEKVLRAVGERFGRTFAMQHGLVGGAAMDATGVPLPEATLGLCKACDAVLFGAVGDPKYDDPQAKVRPEQALLGLRKRLGLFANLRPVWVHPALADASPLRPELVQGVDLIVVRELTGGIYFGQPRLEGNGRAVDTMIYTRAEVERIAHTAFRIARQRRHKVTSVDKANVLACSRLWRQTVQVVAQTYPDVALEHLLIDAATMHLLKRPRDFDVILTGNMFGDILSDESSMLAGSMGMLPSASLGEGRFGLYEPIHGSAPDIAGQGIANPLAAILSAAMLLRHSLELETEAAVVEEAVAKVLDDGYRTPDIATAANANSVPSIVTTQQMGDLIVQALRTAPRN
jgi:3-isopropylmalate dehydrogenase